MPLNTSGPISLGGSTVGQSINLQIGNSATAQVSFNDSTVRSLSGITTNNAQEVMPTDFYGKGATVSYVTSSILNTGSATSGTFTGISIGAADTNRTVFAVLCYNSTGGGTPVITGATINGTTATSLGGAGAGNTCVYIFALKVTTGTTANIVATISTPGTGGYLVASIYRAVNVTTLAANALATWNTSKTATLNVTGSAVGFVIGGASDDNSTGTTWTGLTSNYSALGGVSPYWSSVASSNFATGGAKTISSTMTGGTGVTATFVAVYIV